MDIGGKFRPEDIEKSREYSKTPYYYHVTIIPKGASNIEIHQPGYSDDLNYIGKLWHLNEQNFLMFFSEC